MQKILYVTTVDLSMHMLLLDTLKHIAQCGYEVAGVCSDGPYLAEVEAAGIRVIPVAMTRRITPLKDLVSLYRLYRIFRAERPALVHTHTPKANLLGQWAARLAGVPVQVSTVHGLSCTSEMPRGRRRAFALVERLSALFADCVFFVNAEDAQAACELHLCDFRNVRLLDGGIGVDCGRFDRSRIAQKTSAATRAACGLGPNTLVVGYVGRMVAEKGLHELFEAFRTIRKHYPSARLLLVGPVDTAKPDCVVPEVAAAYGVADCCIFTGLRTDLPELYSLMDVLVLPSHREGFGRVLAEAAAMSLPVIATNIRGCRSTVADGSSGLLVPRKDPAALAAALDELLGDPERRAEMGRRGRALAEARFHQRLAFAALEAEYDRLLS